MACIAINKTAYPKPTKLSYKHAMCQQQVDAVGVQSWKKACLVVSSKSSR